MGENDLVTTNPIVVNWWSNKNLKDPQDYISGSSVSVIWVCKVGHEFALPIRGFVARNFSCPECARVSRSAAANLPDSLLKSWDYTQNVVLPTHAFAGSNKKYHWKCENDHTWTETIPNAKKRKSVCPVCSGDLLVSGINDLATVYPSLIEKWNSDKNNAEPSQISARDSQKRHWIQGCGHAVQASIKQMLSSATRCGICSGQQVLKGFNDLASVKPFLADEWHPTANVDKMPTDFVSGSGFSAWWQCSQGHEWEATILNRAKGNNCPYCSNRKVLAGYNDLKTSNPEIAAQWAIGNRLSPQQVTRQSKYLATWVCDKNHYWKTAVYNRVGKNSTGCPTCWANTFVSKAEQAIFDYVVSLGLEAEQSNRSLLGKRRELDIYVPEKKVAIEFNGLYWHSESAGKDKTYHHDKWKACKDKGIQLIQIWEDEWKRNPEQVKQMLAHKLGVSSQEKVFARKTVVAEISKKEAETFLHTNHIQGYASGSYYLGLKRKENDELVSLIVLKKEAGTNGKTLNIIRYATAANVVGGFTKLLAHAEKLYKPESFITFADHCVSDGGLYENNGFVVDKELAPDYMYIVDGERKHKFGYRLKRFQSDPEVEYVDGLTERELAALNGLERVWDAGKTRYRKTM